MANKLENAESTIKHLYSDNSLNQQQYLSKQISKYNVKNKLLRKMTNLTKSFSNAFSNQPSIDSDMLKQIKITDHSQVKLYEVMEDQNNDNKDILDDVVENDELENGE